MQSLKKMAAIGGGVLFIACWPLAVGKIGQTVFTDGLEYINNTAVNAEIIEYDRGYFSSNATTRYTITDPEIKDKLELDALPTSFVLSHDISHGLLSVSAVTKIEEGIELPASLHTSTQLNGNTDFEVQLEEFSYYLEDESGGIRFSPAVTTGSLSVLGDISYESHFPTIEVEFASGETVDIQNLNVIATGKLIDSMMLGKQSLSLEGFNFKDGIGTQVAEVTGVEYEMDSMLSEDKKTLSGLYTMSVNHIDIAGDKIDNFNLSFGAGNFHKDSFVKLVGLMQANQTLTNEQIDEAFPILEQLLSHGFYINLNKLAMEVGDGEFISQWSLELPSGNSGLSQDIMALFNKLEGNLDTFMSQEMVNSYPYIRQNLDELIIMEFVEESPEGYKVKLKLSNGEVEFANGQSVPLMTVLLPLMM